MAWSSPRGVSHVTTVQITTGNTLCPPRRFLGYPLSTWYPDRENSQGEGVVEPWGALRAGKVSGEWGSLFWGSERPVKEVVVRPGRGREEAEMAWHGVTPRSYTRKGKLGRNEKGARLTLFPFEEAEPGRGGWREEGGSWKEVGRPLPRSGYVCGGRGTRAGCREAARLSGEPGTGRH